MEILITILSLVAFGIGYGFFALKPIIAAVLAFDKGILTGATILWTLFKCCFVAPLVSGLILGIFIITIIIIEEIKK